MKTLNPLLLVVAFLGIGLSSCSNGGPLTTEVRTVAPFNGIDAGDGVKIIVTNGPVQEVTVEAPEKFIQHISTTVSGGNLVIERDQLLTGFSDDITIHITINSLETIRLSGGTQLSSSDVFSASQTNAYLSGGSKLTFNLATNNFNCEASGGSTATMTGSANNVNLTGFSGGSMFKGFDFSTNTLSLNASGGSSLEVRATTQLNVTASGGSMIKYKGSPSINSNLSGGSMIINAN